MARSTTRRLARRTLMTFPFINGLLRGTGATHVAHHPSSVQPKDRTVWTTRMQAPPERGKAAGTRCFLARLGNGTAHFACLEFRVYAVLDHCGGEGLFAATPSSVRGGGSRPGVGRRRL